MRWASPHFSLSLKKTLLVFVAGCALAFPSLSFAFEIDGVSTSSVPWGLHVISDTYDDFATNGVRSFQLNTYRYADDIAFLTKRCIPVDEFGYYEVEDVINYGYYSVAFIDNAAFSDGDCLNQISLSAQQIAVVWGYGSDIEFSSVQLVASLGAFSDRFMLAMGIFFLMLSAVLTYLLSKPL